MKRRIADTAGQSAPHQVYTWSGTPFEIGFQHGKALRKEIITEAKGAIEAFARNRRWTETRALDVALSEWEPLFERHTPRAIEEIKGIAEGAKFDYAWTFFAAVHGGTKSMPPRSGECTAFGCGKKTTQGGKLFIGQTKDTTAPLNRYRIMRLAYENGDGCILLNYPGWISNIGISSQGLACTANSLYARQPALETAPLTFLRRLVMEKSSVDGVLRAIRGLAFDNGCTVIGDATGRLVCLECVDGKTDVLDVSGQAFCHANSVLCDHFQSLEDSVLGSPSSPLRQTNLQRLLNSKHGSITADDLKRFTADHTNFPLSVCRHRSDEDPLCTTAAFVANLTDRELHVAIGNPCVARFETYDFRPMKERPGSRARRHQAA
jgi:isopenicillin-N N-acyltransferase-like protein